MKQKVLNNTNLLQNAPKLTECRSKQLHGRAPHAAVLTFIHIRTAKLSKLLSSVKQLDNLCLTTFIWRIQCGLRFSSWNEWCVVSVLLKRAFMEFFVHVCDIICLVMENFDS